MHEVLSDSENRKMGHFKKIEHKKSGHFKKLARDQFSNRGISKNMHMASREKYIFHMLFGAFHITPGL